MSEPKNKKRTGRPRKTVDEREVVRLASKGYITKEIGMMVGVSEDTLERHFAGALKRGRLLCNGSIRRKQVEVALAGNTTMLIWLGKILLGQSEKGKQGADTAATFDFGDDPRPRAADRSVVN